MWTAGWGTFVALIAAFSVVLWFAVIPFLNREALLATKLLIVFVSAIVCSAFATYALNSVLAVVSRRRRRRS
jgi:hypothetical protein